MQDPSKESTSGDRSATALERVQAHYDRGRFLDAFEASREIGPLEEWYGPDERVLAGRLCHQLGAPRRGYAHHLRAFREAPGHSRASTYYLEVLLRRRGPLAAWYAMHEITEPAPEADDNDRADWLAFQSRLLAQFRDFDRAERYIEEARKICPERAWLFVELSGLRQQEDRYDESLEAARMAVERAPGMPAAILSTCELLQLLGRDDEALDLLARSSNIAQSYAVEAARAGLLMELDRFDEARESLARARELAPLLEQDGREWLASHESDAAYGSGDLETAEAKAREADTPFFERLADRFANRKDHGDRRVLLPVRFVRQHHMTCAPATLTAISSFWTMAADHLAIAEEICYDGTSAHSERRWAESNGWRAREFRVTSESAAALIDAGIPFTLTTSGATTGHLQAVVGYDALRGTLLIRDPYHPHRIEFSTDEMLEHFKSHGPRGMAMVPAAESARLDAIELPDDDMYDRLHTLNGALVDHDAQAARDAYEEMSRSSAEHVLTQQARLARASYESDRAGMMFAAERLLELFPDDSRLTLIKLTCLRDLGRRAQRLALLEELCEDPACDPVYLQLYASELLEDAQRHDDAADLLRRAVRRRPNDGPTYSLLASRLWQSGEREAALDLYRFAACLQDKDERYAGTYFSACRSLGRTDEAMTFLENRFERLGTLASEPVRSLVEALGRLHRSSDAFERLEQAIERRPDDPDLFLFAAECHARFGNADKARALLEDARERTRRSSWLRAAALVDSLAGDTRAALEHWRAIARSEPLAVDAHEAVARLLAESEGRERALEYLEEASAPFPHHVPLLRLRIDWLRDEAPDRAESTARTMIELDPSDAGARRELTGFLLRQGKIEEALEEVQEARRIEPRNPVNFYALGSVFRAMGRPARARAAYARALRLDIDFGPALERLVNTSRTRAGVESALSFAFAQLKEQVSLGPGMRVFYDMAASVLDGETLLTSLRELHEARPHLLASWTVVIQQLLRLGRHDEAIELARRATERFPLESQAWIDLGRAAALGGDSETEIAGLRRAVEVNPADTATARSLAGALERTGDYETSRVVLEEAVSRDPLDGDNHAALADTLWQIGERDEALERAKRATRIDPANDSARELLARCFESLGRADELVDFARELTVERGGHPASWLFLARAIPGGSRVDQRLEAIERAIAIEPREAEAYDMQATLLAEAGRHDEAADACRPEAFGERVPVLLRGRGAWVRAQRGDVAGAIEEMLEVVEDTPSYYWAWAQLAAWGEGIEDRELALRAAREMLRIAPNAPQSLSYLGWAELGAGNREGAATALERALELDPGHVATLRSLLDIRLEDGAIDEARAMLERTAPHVDPAERFAQEARIADAAGDVDRLIECFCELGRLPHAELIRAVFGLVLRHEGKRRDADAALESLIREDGRNPWLGYAWLDRPAAAKSAATLREAMQAIPTTSPLWLSAVTRFFEVAVYKGYSDEVMRLFAEQRERLAAEAEAWATAGYALCGIGEYSTAARWLEDWRDRDGVEPWMLLYVAECLFETDRDEEAIAAHKIAARLPADASRLPHSIEIAATRIEDGDIARAAKKLGKPDLDSQDRRRKILLRLIQAAGSTARTGKLDARTRAQIDLARKGVEKTPGRYLRRKLNACLDRIVHESPGWRTRWFAWRKRVKV